MAEQHDDPSAGLKRALKSVIEQARLQRQGGRSGKSTAKLSGTPKKRKKAKAKSQKLNRKRGGEQLTVGEQRKVDNLVSPSAQQHGVFEPVDFSLVETVHEGGKKIKQHTVQVVMNRGGTAIERWHRRGRIDDRQLSAIMVYQGAWRVHIGEQRVIANYAAYIGGGMAAVNAALELHANTKIRAKQTLRLLDQEIFFRRGVDDFNIWQNVVIFDEPAGIAGSRLGYSHKPAEAVAQCVVASVAHEIASLVIDQMPPDLSQLLLDIDAPRQPRRKFT